VKLLPEDGHVDVLPLVVGVFDGPGPQLREPRRTVDLVGLRLHIQPA
jgi:hypothetical protein